MSWRSGWQLCARRHSEDPFARSWRQARVQARGGRWVYIFVLDWAAVGGRTASGACSLLQLAPLTPRSTLHALDILWQKCTARSESVVRLLHALSLKSHCRHRGA